MFLAPKSWLIPCILPKEHSVTRKAKGWEFQNCFERMLNFYFLFCFQWHKMTRPKLYYKKLTRNKMEGRKAGQMATLFSFMATSSLWELVYLWILILPERNTNRTCPGNREKMLFDMWIRPCWQIEHLPDTASKLRHLEKWAPHSSVPCPQYLCLISWPVETCHTF